MTGPHVSLFVLDTGPLITLAAAESLDYLLFPNVPVRDFGDSAFNDTCSSNEIAFKTNPLNALSPKFQTAGTLQTRRTSHQRRPARALADHHFHRRSEERPHRRALRVQRSDER
jgi:hypothetical protein